MYNYIGIGKFEFELRDQFLNLRFDRLFSIEMGILGDLFLRHPSGQLYTPLKFDTFCHVHMYIVHVYMLDFRRPIEDILETFRRPTCLIEGRSSVRNVSSQWVSERSSIGFR